MLAHVIAASPGWRAAHSGYTFASASQSSVILVSQKGASSKIVTTCSPTPQTSALCEPPIPISHLPRKAEALWISLVDMAQMLIRTIATKLRQTLSQLVTPYSLSL